MAARVQTDPRDHLLDLLASNEETATDFQALVDKVAPGAVAASRVGDRINNVIAASLADIDKTKKELDAALHATRVRNVVDGERRTLLESPLAREHGLTADDLPAIEKIMLDEGIAKHTTAAQYYVNARIVGAPRADAYDGLTMPRNDLGAYWQGSGQGRGITDGPSPRQRGEAWSRDRAHKDIAALRAGRPLESAPFTIPEIDARGHLR